MFLHIAYATSGDILLFAWIYFRWTMYRGLRYPVIINPFILLYWYQYMNHNVDSGNVTLQIRKQQARSTDYSSIRDVWIFVVHWVLFVSIFLGFHTHLFTFFDSRYWQLDYIERCWLLLLQSTQHPPGCKGLRYRRRCDLGYMCWSLMDRSRFFDVGLSDWLVLIFFLTYVMNIY